MVQRDYIDGSAKVQVALILLLMLAVGLFFYLESIISQVLADIQLLAGSEPDLAIRMAGRLLLWLVLFSGSIAIAISGYLLVLAVRVRRTRCYPPPDMPVAFRTKLKFGDSAIKMVAACRWLALLLLFQPLLGLYIWYRITGGAW